jgi:potassium efflux system protein
MRPSEIDFSSLVHPAPTRGTVAALWLLWALCMVLCLLPARAMAAPAAGPLGALQGTLGGGNADKERRNAVQAQLDAAASAGKEADALAQELDRLRAKPLPNSPCKHSESTMSPR